MGVDRQTLTMTRNINLPLRRSKRLAIFAPDLTVGGAERSILKLAGGLIDRGYPVDLVLSNAQGPLLDEVPDSLRVVDFKGKARNHQPSGLDKLPET